jgi:hypothetical protein
MILVATSGSSGTMIHTAINSVGSIDQLWLYAMNNHTSSVDLTIEFGGEAAEDFIRMGIPSRSGLYLVVPGSPLKDGVIVRAFASVVNVISILSFCYRESA